MTLARIRQLRDVILTRVTEQRRARLSELELQTRYLVQAIWATAPGVKRGQAQKAADAIRFLPAKPRRRTIPTVRQVLTMFPPDQHTLVRG